MTIRGRIVTVKGKKGEITKNFKHMPVEMQIMN
jgi:ribosomal protein L6P/L9E